MAAPMDLNILYEANRANLEKKVLTAFRLGYSTVAINYVTEKLSSIPNARNIKVSEAKVKQLGIRRELRQYTRITVKVSERTSVSRMLEADIQAYDIIAVRPNTDKLFQVAAVTLDVDLISVDLSENMDFFFQYKLVKKARVRRTAFELCYSPTIRDRTLRKNVFTNASNLIGSKARNVIITSECENPTELRSPKDVMNLGMLFGLSEVEAKAAVTTNARAVIVRAFSRRCMQKRVMSMERITPKGQEKVTDLPLPIETEDAEADDSDEEEILPEMDEVEAETAETAEVETEIAEAAESRKRSAEDENGETSNKRVKTESANGS